jgi:GNAT superfamily N-acetyltransferase
VIAGIALRRAGPADLRAVIDLRIEFERITRDSGSLDEAARRAELQALFGPDLAAARLAIWLAEEGGRAVGQAALREGPRGEGELMSVYTDPGYRRRGIGAALVGLAIDEARARGLERLELQPTDDSRRIYEREGFVAAGRRMVLSLRSGR